MLDFLGCTPSIRALQARVSIALPLVVLIQTSYAIAPKMCGTFFPAAPRILDIRRSYGESMTGKGTTFSRTAIQLTQEQASALRFVFAITPTRLAPIGRKRSVEIRVGR
jgi:hypothetical protein